MLNLKFGSWIAITDVTFTRENINGSLTVDGNNVIYAGTYGLNGGQFSAVRKCTETSVRRSICLDCSLSLASLTHVFNLMHLFVSGHCLFRLSTQEFGDLNPGDNFVGSFSCDRDMSSSGRK